MILAVDTYFREWFYYKNGELYWKKSPANHIYKDMLAGSNDTKGYIQVRLHRKKYHVHRIIWILHNGAIPKNLYIDHIDGIKSNNKIENLRLSTNSQNQQNAKRSTYNTTGVKGLSYNQASRLWRGQVMINGKSVYKSSMKREYIENWLIEQREKLHGEFTNHG